MKTWLRSQRNPPAAKPARPHAVLLPTILRHRYDLLGIIGLLTLVHGIAMVYRPAAWIVGGAGAIVIAILAEAGTKKQQEPKP